MGKICLKEEKSGTTHIQALVLWCVTRQAFPTLCLLCGSEDIYSQRQGRRMGLARDQRDYNRTVLVITYVYTMLLLNI